MLFVGHLPEYILKKNTETAKNILVTHTRKQIKEHKLGKKKQQQVVWSQLTWNT